MPGPRAAQNLQMPYPRDWQGKQMPRSSPGRGGWVQLEYLFGGKTERNEVSKGKHWKFNIAIDNKVSILKCFSTKNAVQVQLCLVLF